MTDEPNDPISQIRDTAAEPEEKPEVPEPDPDMEVRRHSRTLERPLTDAERLKIGDEMAEAMERAGQLEAKKKAIDDELKEDIAEHWGKASTLASALRKGQREAMIDCETRRDFKAGTVEVIRLDTGEAVEPLRAMTVAERQVALFGGSARSSEPEVIDGIVNPGSWAEESDLNPQQEENLGIAPQPSPAEAIAQTAQKEAPDA